MSRRAKKYLIIAAVVVGVLALFCVLVVPKLVDVNRYRPEVAAYIQSKTGKPARIGRLELTLFPHLAIQVDNFSMGNPKGFPAGDFFTSQRIYALLQAGPLWNKKIVIQSLIIEKPVIHLLSAPSGRWNFENPPKAPSAARSPAPPSAGQGFSLGSISQVSIEHGRVTIANLLASGKAGPTYFDGQGLSCRFRNVNASALANTASGPSGGDPASGQSVPFHTVSGKNSPPAAQGSFHADSLRFGAIQVTAMNSQIRIFPGQAYLNNIDFQLAGGTVSGNAAIDFSRRNLTYSVKTAFQKLDVARLLNAFPSARGRMTGTMQGRIDLNGEAAHSSDPLSGLQGAGQVNIRNGRLPSLQLNKNLLLLVRAAGIGASSGDPASFSSISSDLNIASQQLVTRHVRIVSNDVDVVASGKVDLTGSNQMNYAGTAKVPARQSGLTDLVAGLSGATFANGKLSFPFALSGTVDNPRFVLKTTKGVLSGFSTGPAPGGKQGQQSGNPLQNLINLFSKKKASQPPK